MASSPPPTRDSAGIRFPPPILYLIPLLTGLSFDRHLASWRPPALIAHLLGVSFALAATALFFSTVPLFRRNRTTLRTDRTSNALLVDGPYRFTRNPLYLSFAVLYLGLALLLRSPGALLLWPVAIALVQTIVIHREESYLARCFGIQYLAYRSRVRRWL